MNRSRCLPLLSPIFVLAFPGLAFAEPPSAQEVALQTDPTTSAAAATQKRPTETLTANLDETANDETGENDGVSETVDEGPWRNEFLRFDLGGFLSWYTAAVEVGTDGESNQQLIDDFSFGLHAAASWRFWGPFSLGMFMQFETGERNAGRFTGTVMGDLAVSETLIGGTFSEVWWGPLLRAQWESLFLEVGWGALGFRSDDGRPDLPAGGSTDGAFQTTPSTAWLVALGASVEVYGPIELLLRISYRVRYYETRGGSDLDQGLGFGTQDVIPFIGAAWAIDKSILD